MTAFVQHFAFEFRTGLRNKDLFLLNYLFPFGFYLMMGALMGGINPPFIKTLIPAMSIFAVLSGEILGLPNPLVEAREAGIFRSFKINGVPALSILVIPALTTAFHSIIVAILITVTAPLFFAAPLPVNWLGFAVTLFLLAFSGAGLGALIGVIATDARSTVLWSQLIYLPSILLGGMMVPISLLPPAMATASALLPASHAMQGFMGLAYQQATDWDPLWALLVLLAGGILAFVMAVYLFSWDSQNTTRRGHPALALIALLPFILSAVILA